MVQHQTLKLLIILIDTNDRSCGRIYFQLGPRDSDLLRRPFVTVVYKSNDDSPVRRSDHPVTLTITASVINHISIPRQSRIEFVDATCRSEVPSARHRGASEPVIASANNGRESSSV